MDKQEVMSGLEGLTWDDWEEYHSRREVQQIALAALEMLRSYQDGDGNQIKRESGIGFSVIDPKTGEYPNVWKIALTEEWAKQLMYGDIDEFAISEEGQLVLLDECGNYAYCPEGRFETTVANA